MLSLFDFFFFFDVLGFLFENITGTNKLDVKWCYKYFNEDVNDDA